MYILRRPFLLVAPRARASHMDTYMGDVEEQQAAHDRSWQVDAGGKAAGGNPPRDATLQPEAGGRHICAPR